MALSSMTGFARSSGQDSGAAWAWELKSVNAKGLDIRLKLPPRLDVLDAEARRMLGAVIIRGTVHVGLEVVHAGGGADIRVNAPLARRLLRELAEVARQEGVAPPGLDAVLHIKGVIEVAEDERGLSDDLHQALQQALHRGLEDAIVALVTARRQEGAAVQAILSGKLREMAEKVRQADSLPGRSVDAVRERLRRQVDDLLATGAPMDPQRLHQEAALLSVKADIREELDRLDAHVTQAGELLARGGPVGRRLDFLAQELSREVNTLCAKSNDVALTAIGLDLKGLVEQFREQVQNVE